jgi:hypothetical protein
MSVLITVFGAACLATRLIQELGRYTIMEHDPFLVNLHQSESVDSGIGYSASTSVQANSPTIH